MIGVVLLAGLFAGIYILRSGKAQPSMDEHGHPAEAAGHGDEANGHDDDKHAADANEPQKGPHGGRLFVAEGYGLELSIFEQGVEPQFRIYTYQNGKPADPDLTKATSLWSDSARSRRFSISNRKTIT